ARERVGPCRGETARAKNKERWALAHPCLRAWLQHVLQRDPTAPFACAVAGTTPSCCSIPSASQLTWDSAILPLAGRLIVIPSIETFLLVGAMPRKSPL